MKYKTLRNRLYVLGVGIVGLLIWVSSGIFAPPVVAQGACTVSGATFNPSGVQSAPDFHMTGDPSTVQVSVQIQDCAGSEVEVAVYSGSTRIDDFSTTPPSTSTGSATLTGAIDTGEQGCGGTFNPNCRLSIRAYVDSAEVLNTFTTNYQNPGSGFLGYSCYGGCDDDFGPMSFTPPNWATPGGGGTTGSTGGDFLKLENPIQYDNIPDVIRQFITIVFVIGIPLVAFAIIYAGFLLVTAGGSQDKLKKGKQALLAGVIGGAILLGAWVIAEAIQGTVDQIRGV